MATLRSALKKVPKSSTSKTVSGGNGKLAMLQQKKEAAKPITLTDFIQLLDTTDFPIEITPSKDGKHQNLKIPSLPKLGVSASLSEKPQSSEYGGYLPVAFTVNEPLTNLWSILVLSFKEKMQAYDPSVDKLSIYVSENKNTINGNLWKFTKYYNGDTPIEGPEMLNDAESYDVEFTLIPQVYKRKTGEGVLELEFRVDKLVAEQKKA